MKLHLLVALASSLGACSAASPDGAPASFALPSPSPRASTIDKRRHPSSRLATPAVTRTSRLSRLSRLARVAPPTPRLTPAPKLAYQGGPLLDDVEVYAIFWGSNVDAATRAGLPAFFGATSGDGPYMQMLTEYDTNGFVIGHGAFKSAVVDAQAPPGTLDPASMTYTLHDEDVQAELARLVDAGTLPAPDGKNIFMVYFDAATLIDDSCRSFCAYHNSFDRNGTPIYYAVMPDHGHNGCEQGCGFDTVLDNLYSSSSHELVEAVSDADVGDNVIGWIDNGSGDEIGDICTDWNGVAGGYVVQSQWSNESNGCRDHRPATVASASVSAMDATVAPGGTATFDVTTSGSAPGPFTFDVMSYTVQVGNQGATKEFPFTFTPATVQPGGTSVLKLSVPANETQFGFGTLGYQLKVRIAATDADGVHRFVEVNLDVVTGAPTISSITPTSGRTLGGTAVAVKGGNFAADAQGYFCPSTGTCTPATNAVPVVGGTTASDGKSFAFTTPDYKKGACRFMLVNPADSAHPAFVAFNFTVAGKSAPSISGVDPASGPVAGGTNVVVGGSNFDQGVNGAGTPNLTLTVGGTAVTAQNYYVADAQHIYVTMPAHAAGAVAVAVKNADGQSATSAAAFTYGSDNAPATGLALGPAMGSSAGGDLVIVSGDNFVSGATVTFGGVAATVKSFNPGFLDVETPPHAPGDVAVVVTNPMAPPSAAVTFSYVTAPPDMTPPPDLGSAADMGDDGEGAPADMARAMPAHPGTNTLPRGGGCSIAGASDDATAPSLLPLLFLCIALALRTIVRTRTRRVDGNDLRSSRIRC